MKIKVLTVDKQDSRLGIHVDDVYTVTGLDPEGDFYIDELPEDYASDYHVSNSRVLFRTQVEVVNMELKDVYVGQLVRVVDTVPVKGFNYGTFSVYGEREGTVIDVDYTGCELQVCIELDGIATWGLVQDIEPVTEVIKVNCRKPNVLQRIWNYLRGIK